MEQINLPLNDALKKYFGYEKFRPGQEEIIESIISGKNVVAILPTGSGKSICYQIPALICNSFAVIISPLISLMKDQVDSLNLAAHQSDINENIAAFINSSLDYTESEKVLNEVASGKIKLLYVSPEKLTNQSFVERIKKLRPEYLFIDEAHCISEWGHNFRPSYRRIKEFAEYCSLEKISAFTATATPEVRQDIIEQLNLKNPKVFVRGFERNNLSINVIQTNNKKEKCLEILKKEKLPAIVYAATRKNTEELSAYLTMNKINAAFYHAGLNPEMRRIIQDDFINDRLNVIAATNAFGMGIDKSNIRTVIHYNMPGSVENYYQEIGRAGRDNLEANVCLLYNNSDKTIQEFLISNSYPAFEQTALTYNLICDYAKVSLGSITNKEIPLDDNFIKLLELKGVSRNLLLPVIKILADSGYLTLNDSDHKRHYVRFTVNESQLKNYLKKTSNDFFREIIIYLLREYGSSLLSSKSAVNLEKISAKLDTTFSTVDNNLEMMSNAGILEYEKPLKIPSVKLLKSRVKSESLQLKMGKSILLMNNAREKLQRMVEFINYDDCRFKFIINYFGEDAQDYNCGKCDNCRGKGPGGKEVKSEYLQEIILKTLGELNSQISSKNLIKILRGITKKRQYISLSSFGSCEHFTEEEILITIDNMTRMKLIENTNGNLTFTGEEEIFDNITFAEKDSGAYNYESDLELFNKLRMIRKEASEKFNQPPYMICADEVLREIVKVKPKTPSELLAIKNFSLRMFNKAGENFLAAIKDFQSNIKAEKKLEGKSLPPNIRQIYELVNKKYLLEDISRLIKLPEAVVSMQIETIIELFPQTDITSLITKEELDLILKKISEGITDLKELKKSMPNKISYGKIRVVLAKHKRQNVNWNPSENC